jgi:hypothetical protein
VEQNRQHKIPMSVFAFIVIRVDWVVFYILLAKLLQKWKPAKGETLLLGGEIPKK